VKTNDALRIRDILQGYIDIIRRRMDAKSHQHLSEHHVITEDNILVSKYVLLNISLLITKRGARWPRGQCVRRAIAEAK
jgi:hypothetical protein